MNTKTAGNIKKEIIALHRFFEDWATARIPENESSINRLKEALAEDFEIITPGAKAICRSQLIEMIQNGYGNFSHQPEAYKIWIEDVAFRSLGTHYYVATYKEWQKIKGEIKGRFSTVIFSYDEHTPYNLKWHHVHETWLSPK